MPIPTGGFAGVQVGFEPLPAGVYDAEITDAEVRKAGEEAKNPGSEYIAWEFTITDEEYEGRKAWLNTSLTEKAKPLMKAFLIAVGYTEEELDDPGFEFEPDEEVGKKLKVVLSVGKNPRTKEPNNSVRRVLPIDSQEANLPD